MRLYLGSDLHLEFGSIKVKNTDNAKVLVLSGDICIAKDLHYIEDRYNKKSVLFHDFFKQACDEFEHVVYVMGNHEHYDGDFNSTYSLLKERLSVYNSLHVLEKETVKIDDVVFIGGTLWTDMNDEDPLTMLHVKSCMNDYNCIVDSRYKLQKRVPLYKKDEAGKSTNVKIGTKFKSYDSKLTPESTVRDHRKMLDYIEAVLANNKDKQCVVVTHHAPSRNSIHDVYKHDTLMNGGYVSSLDFFIEDHPQIKLWTHGHTHHKFDYTVGNTRVVCNPRGYFGHEPQATNFTFKLLEV